MKALTEEEAKILYDTLGILNYYEICGLIVRAYNCTDEDVELKRKTIVRAIIKLGIGKEKGVE